MNYKEAADILRNHNQWRRDKNTPAETKMQEPRVLGEAIDTATEVLYSLSEKGDSVTSNEYFCKEQALIAIAEKLLDLDVAQRVSLATFLSLLRLDSTEMSEWFAEQTNIFLTKIQQEGHSETDDE